MSAARGALLVVALIGESSASPQEANPPDVPRASVRHEVSAGGMIRLLRRDPGLIGGGNGGTGTSVNYDDGNLNYGRGLGVLAIQGRSTIEARAGAADLKAEVVYFYDVLNARGDTDYRPLSDEARDRAGRAIYLNEAYVGYKWQAAEGAFRIRAGNEILRWSESRSFGHSIAPVNPVSGSRRYQPGNTADDFFVALPMVTARVESAGSWKLDGFYLLGFKPSELDAAGTFLGTNDFYAPGGRYLQLGQGSPLVPDADISTITPATPFGSRVPRAGDRRPNADGQIGLRIELPGFGTARTTLAGYAMRVHNREPIVSVNTGTLGGLLRLTAPDYASSGSYFVEHPAGVTVLGASLRSAPAVATRVGLEYSMRRAQPLQIDDDVLITAGLAPAAALGACAPNPASALCAATLAALNRNPLIAARGGITAANAAQFFSQEVPGYERFNVSQYSASLVQGLPPLLHASQGFVAAEVGANHVHGFKDHFLDASVSVRPDASGARRRGLATRSAWGYRLTARLDYADVLGLRSVSPSLTWIQDVKGNAPVTFGTLLEGARSAILGAEFVVDPSLSARLAYRTFLGKGNDADRHSDRDFIAFSLTRRF